MYSILIVDDEAIERSVIKYLIAQNHFDLQIYEACNGKDALDLMQDKPIDILLTDVRMPIVDGMNLTEKAKQLYPDISIIFFSNYKDFSYVKKALELQAVNYIMKPVDPDEFHSTITKVLSCIQEQKRQLNQSQKQMSIIQNHILYKLINNTSIKHIKALYPQTDLSFISECRRLILFQTERDYFSVSADEDEFFFPAADLKHILPAGSHLINLNPAQNVLILTGPEHHILWYEDLADKLTRHIQEICQIICYAAVSKPVVNPDDLSSAYEETERKLTAKLFNGDRFPDNRNITEHMPYSDDILLNRLETAVQLKDSVSLRSHINLIIDNARSDGGYSQIYFRFLCTSILNILLDGISPDEKEQHFDEYAAIIAQSLHLAPIESLLFRLTEKLIASFEKETESPLQILRQVKQYIHKHYQDDLSLDILAKKVYLSPNYLSRLFTEYNDCGINKYIKKVRMKKAKELLLNTPLSVKEIAKQIGYSSDSYFCKSFLKDFDVTPEKFRNQNGGTFKNDQ